MEYEYLLENNCFSVKDIDPNDNIYKTVIQQFSNISNEPLYVSLSGGVDSMVLINILKTKFEVKALHINYKNRFESDEEELFLKEWTKVYQIPINILDLSHIKRFDTDRSFYEKETNRLRYHFYKEYTQKILLGHHKNDIIENTLSNIANKKGILNINSMPYQSIINNVIVCRPLIDLYKSDIIEFAHKYDIPYFKDTTPQWSNRWKLRNQIFPITNLVYKNYESALYTLSKESQEIREIMYEKIIDPILHKIRYKINNKYMKIFIDKKLLIEEPLAIWKIVFTSIMHDFDLNMFSQKSLKELFNSKLLYGIQRCLSSNITALLKFDLIELTVTL